MNNLTYILLHIFLYDDLIHQHPDVGISYSDRASYEFQNETPERVENSRKFRGFNSLLAEYVLRPVGAPIVSSFHGKSNDRFWNLETNTLPVPAPLEQTGYFEDGLYEKVEATPTPLGIMPPKATEDE